MARISTTRAATINLVIQVATGHGRHRRLITTAPRTVALNKAGASTVTIALPRALLAALTSTPSPPITVLIRGHDTYRNVAQNRNTRRLR